MAARVLLGVVGRPHGVRGLLHVQSFAVQQADLASYTPLSDDRGRQFALRWAGQGVAELTELTAAGPRRIADRDAAGRLVNMRLYVERDRLPQPDADEFYIADLVGLAVVGRDGAALGRVAAVHDYGAGASLEIERPDAPPLLVPFTRAAVPEVDPRTGRLVVQPPAEVEAP
ncbi:MAG: 16S rRNA processing protein RimM [Acidisphaera sp.]|nr:16S rRNA processing protein RimM [Acidisphaera sp.]